MNTVAKVLFNRYTALLLGLVFLASSVLAWQSREPISEVFCDGERMRPGDSCTHSQGADVRINTYEQELAEQQANQDNPFIRIVCPILTVLTIGGSVFVMVRGRRRTASADQGSPGSSSS